MPPADKADRDLRVDEAVERYLPEYPEESEGRERRTGPVRQDAALWVRASWMNRVRRLYMPPFHWAKRWRIVTRNLIADFDTPKSIHATKESGSLSGRPLAPGHSN